MHIILGAGGALSAPLAQHLLANRQTVRLVSRRGAKMTGAETVRADLLDPAATLGAIERDATVYLVAGVPYSAAAWAAQWPVVMRNVLDACAVRHAKLIFFDNVYLYGKAQNMTEDTPVRPCSRKGAVRARIADEFMQAVGTGRVQGCIARSADFYGPHAEPNGVPNLLVFAPLAAGKRAAWLGNAKLPHSLTYTPDCARALALLAASSEAWGQVWHLPTAAPAITGREFVALAAQALGAPDKVMELAGWMVCLAGLFDRTKMEALEMFYQSTLPYRFDSTKFEKRFGFTPTPYPQGIAETAAAYRSETAHTPLSIAR